MLLKVLRSAALVRDGLGTDLHWEAKGKLAGLLRIRGFRKGLVCDSELLPALHQWLLQSLRHHHLVGLWLCQRNHLRNLVVGRLRSSEDLSATMHTVQHTGRRWAPVRWKHARRVPSEHVLVTLRNVDVL